MRITYQGPPTEFGWLLPAPPDVQVSESSAQLFVDLDARFAPVFTLRTEFDDDCQQLLANRGGLDGGQDAGLAFPEDEGEGGVQVLSREAVGAFDVATLQADAVEDLRAWLDENGYQIPQATDEKLAPYIELGAAFVAVKLLPDRDSGDISPLRLSFDASRASIPIVPTSVAAEPDMGIIVHVLGDARAIPLNYRHVVINEAAIDWQNGGQNYPDVVSQAADEAQGKAFATDYSGPPGSAPAPWSDATLDAVRAAETPDDLLGALGLFDLFFQPLDVDLQRVLPTGLILPDDLPLTDYLNCPGCYEDAAVEIDGQALAERIAEELNPPREALQRLFEGSAQLTRLYSTLSAAEMDLDPEFEFNPDLGEVPNRRQAVQRVACRNDQPDFDNAIIETPSGIRFRLVDGLNPNVIGRQGGETVRGVDVPGARVIERTMEAGPSEVVSDATDDIVAMNAVDLDADEGCACDAADGSMPTAALAVLLLIGLRRRR